MQWGKFGSLNTVPIFCANCGKLGGYVPEENCTFAVWLCDDPCAEKYGVIAGTLCMPDEMFWAKVAQEQLDRYGRFLTEQELLEASSNSTNPLSSLLKESPILKP